MFSCFKKMFHFSVFEGEKAPARQRDKLTDGFDGFLVTLKDYSDE